MNIVGPFVRLVILLASVVRRVTILASDSPVQHPAATHCIDLIDRVLHNLSIIILVIPFVSSFSISLSSRPRHRLTRDLRRTMDFLNLASSIFNKTSTAFPFTFDPKNQKNVDRDGLWSISDGIKRVSTPKSSFLFQIHSVLVAGLSA